jgi:hypothetical protein
MKILLSALALALFQDEPVLERYAMQPPGFSDITTFSRYFGGGSASARYRYVRGETSSSLTLQVWRFVPPGFITFALLVDRVEIRGYDSDRKLIYSRDLAGFTFGDSASGFWCRRLTDLPMDLAVLEFNFFGNYE